jgi:hypothetical protein
MGSSGSGRISDYPGSSPSGRPGGAGGGDATPDRCDKAFGTRLEDVEQSEYYITQGTVPPVGTPLQIELRKRIVAQTASGESIGNFPTSFNYLAACMKAGWKYVGTVRSVAGAPPVASVSVDFKAIAPK